MKYHITWGSQVYNDWPVVEVMGQDGKTILGYDCTGEPPRRLFWWVRDSHIVDRNQVFLTKDTVEELIKSEVV